ncbi:two-component system, sporulation sensor kinase A [Thalassobacillus cyri]|uniref:histidine kinase n=1 Tax=Thalassobacillus cyri TaxID=571932 RepID=A0A1H3Y0M1_9BACI|nr:PAS domain S-box protein [Thalassobacillus cyri]SEA05156.1 two-component system, sporulation sensor kinase A [Thalassobacillus cyri]
MLDNIETQGAFMNAFNQAFIGMAIVNMDGNFMMVNRSFCKILGFTEEEILQKNVMDLTPPEDFKLVATQFQRLVEEDIEAFEIVKRCYKNNGGMIWGRLSISIYQDESQESHLIIQLQDVTERKLEEEELMVREREFRKLVEGAPDAMAIHDEEQILYINQVATETLGVKAEDVIGKPLSDFILKEDWLWYREKLVEALENGEVNGIFDIRLVLPSGETIDVSSTGSIIEYHGRKAMQAVFRNNSAQKEFEMKSNYLLQQYEKMNLVGELAAGIAHEIKNPLTILKGFIQLLDISKHKREHTQYESLMFSEIDRIHLMVNEFLTLAKPSEEDMKPIDLHVALKQTISLMHAHAVNNKVTIQFEENTSLPLVHGIENKLKQAFINIIKNAIEAMHEGGRLRIIMDQCKDGMKISFADEGCGMTEEELRKITTPFFTTKSDGTGLGMMITNNIVESHNGKLQVESKMGAGTTISIAFPL